jgi:hypothetical protein
MSKRRSLDGRHANRPPEGQPWIWHTLELKRSAAWLGRSIHCIRLLEFLEREHLEHGGMENGELVAPYSQLERNGIGRRFIWRAIHQCNKRGLLKVKRGGRKGTTMTECSRYTLTYMWTRQRDENGMWQWFPPTDEWRRYSDEPENRCTLVHLNGAPSSTGIGAPSYTTRSLTG